MHLLHELGKLKECRVYKCRKLCLSSTLAFVREFLCISDNSHALITSAGNLPRTCRPVSPGLAQVGAAAAHLDTRVENQNDSDGGFRGEAVLSLPPAAIFETMVADGHASSDADFAQAPTEATAPLPGPSSRRDLFPVPASQATPSTAVAPPPLAEPSVPRAQAAVLDIAEPFSARAARSSAAENRIAAMERVLQEEAQARARGIEKEQERRQELHDLEVARLKRQMHHEEWKQTIERKTARLELKIKQTQLAALNRQLDG